MVVNSYEERLFYKTYDLIYELYRQNRIQTPLRELISNSQDLVLEDERIVINTSPSPDGAMGAFLLLKKHRFLSYKYCGSLKGLSLMKKILAKDKQDGPGLHEHHVYTRIQDYFETRFKEVATSIGLKVVGVCSEHMNEYDFIVYSGESEFEESVLVEVKSDAYMNTGNISLELVRDMNKGKQLTNIGSIFKTRADYWYVYYYDRKNPYLSFYPLFYPVCLLKSGAYEVLEMVFHE